MYLEYRHQIPSFDATTRHELPKRHFHQENWNTTDYQENAVGDKESASSVFVAKVRKTPHVSKANKTACNGEDELALFVPLDTLMFDFFFVCLNSFLKSSRLS